MGWCEQDLGQPQERTTRITGMQMDRLISKDSCRIQNPDSLLSLAQDAVMGRCKARCGPAAGAGHTHHRDADGRPPGRRRLARGGAPVIAAERCPGESFLSHTVSTTL